MAMDNSSAHADAENLNQKNQELAGLRREHGRCKRKTSLYGALGGILLALSCLGSFKYIVSQETDWSKNPNSPVYEIARQNETRFQVPLYVLLGGVGLGLGMFFKARKHFVSQEQLWFKQNLLILEIRELRDRLYPRQASAAPQVHTISVENTQPLQAGEAREEYFGVYSPPEQMSSIRH